MGNCFNNSSGKLLENDIDAFFNKMLIRTTTLEKLDNLLKRNWKNGNIKKEDWSSLVKDLLCLSTEGIEMDNYKVFWDGVYDKYESSINYLIVSLYLLCEKNILLMKQKFERLHMGILKQMTKNDFEIESIEIEKARISKIYIENIIVYYMNILFCLPLKLASPINEENSIGKGYLEVVYTYENIKKYSEFIMMKVDEKEKSKRSNSKEGFIDYDLFVEFVYSEYLSNDVKLRKEFSDYVELYISNKVESK